ncbi:MAG: integrin alpha [Candidatus Midichloria sp.]|nr:integrin alpha [Candidatus Midichloria sp.]
MVTIGFTINGIASSDNAGYSVASAGDINNDGFDDIISEHLMQIQAAELVRDKHI